ncbi:MAG: phosphoglycerate mutase [Nitrospirales bacterium]|nr:phosphoglycerate mutase [Nitrospirales bacterium]
MKYIIIHGEGFADVPSRELGGRTPLQAAATPNMDRLASGGELGLATLAADVPVGGSDVMTVALLGYDPRKVHAGPAPFEAVGQGIAVGEQDVVFRCSMVTLRAGTPGTGTKTDVKKLGPSVVLDDDGAAGLEDDDARELIEAINEQLGSESVQFYPGAGHRHLMVWVGGKSRTTCVDPHEVVGKPIGEYLPTGDGADILRRLMEASLNILSLHPVNDARRDAGLKPVNYLWLWGQGRRPQLATLIEERQVSGAMISMSDVHRGIGLCAGLEAVDPTLLTESGDTDFQSRGEAALMQLSKKDLAYVHVQMPSYMAAVGDPKEKVNIIEECDRTIVGPMLQRLDKLGPYRMVLLCETWRSSGSRVVANSLSPYVFYEGPAPTKQQRGFSEPEAEIEAEKAGARDASKFMARLVPRV